MFVLCLKCIRRKPEKLRSKVGGDEGDEEDAIRAVGRSFRRPAGWTAASWEMLTCPQQFVTWDFYMVCASRPFFCPSLVLATKFLQDDNNAVCSESLVLPLSVPILSWYFYIHTNILAGSIISLLGYNINTLPFIYHRCKAWSMLCL
jgi:hypothetical protein